MIITLLMSFQNSAFDYFRNVRLCVFLILGIKYYKQKHLFYFLLVHRYTLNDNYNDNCYREGLKDTSGLFSIFSAFCQNIYSNRMHSL